MNNTKKMQDVGMSDFVRVYPSQASKPVESVSVSALYRNGDKVATVTVDGNSTDLFVPAQLSAGTYDGKQAMASTGAKEIVVDGVAVLSAIRALEARVAALEG